MEKYEILVSGAHVGAVLDDWMSVGECDLRLLRVKAKGCRVIETKDRLYAERVFRDLDMAEEVNLIKQSIVSNYEDKTNT